MAEVDIVVYRGHKYRRYPSSQHLHHRRYFYGTEPRRGFYHRHKWEDENGPIPETHEIHHKDENTLNNDLTNLECVEIGWHRSFHLSKRARNPEHLAHLDAIRDDAKAWHASDEGRHWHSEHGKKSWEGRFPEVVQCVCCGADVETYFPTRTKFCDNNCGARYKRRGPDVVLDPHPCLCCGKPLTKPDQKYCDWTCGDRYRRRGPDGDRPDRRRKVVG